MTPLRQRMIREMQLRQFAPRTIESLCRCRHRPGHILSSARPINSTSKKSVPICIICSPNASWRKAPATLRAAAITFFYRDVLGQEAFDLKIPPQAFGQAAGDLQRQELVRLFEAAAQPARSRVSDDHLCRGLASQGSSATSADPHSFRSGN